MSRITIDVSHKGKWSRVQALEIDDKRIIRNGKWLRIAIVHAEQWLETPVQDPDACIQALKAEKSGELHCDIFTFCQKLPVLNPSYKYPMERESVAAIPLTSFDDWWTKLPQETRKNVRRSQKREVVVTVKPLDRGMIEGLVALNNDSPLRQGKAYTHFGKSFEQVERDQQDFLDRSDYICAYYKDELIGMVKLIYRGDVASILFFLSKASHNDKRPSNALMARVVEECEKRGVKYIIFGFFNYQNKRDSSLRDFKIRHGFEEVLVPRYYVPLTLKGRLAVWLKLYRGPLGLLPTPVINFLVNARAKLNRRKTSRCSSMPEQSNCNRQMGRSIPPAGSKV